MLTLLLFYQYCLNLANANDNAIVIRPDGEVIPWTPPNDQSLADSPPISIDVVRMDITSVIRIFIEHSESNIILADGIQGTISAQLTNTPWQLALYTISQSNGWTLLKIGDIWMITP